jgi:hypothetical protein
MQPLGYVLWEGESLLNGDPIVAIATGFQSRSTNKKTGDMVQTWILCQNSPPTQAIKDGADVAICGSCWHRGDPLEQRSRSCYVEVGRAPTAVWNAWKRGRYAIDSDPGVFAGRLIRLGAYGDPAAVPADVWSKVCESATGWTGYTHQWRTAAPALARLCMASCDSEAERAEARLKGYRSFRVTKSLSPTRLDGEVFCPASEIAGNKLTCNTCLSCNGTATQRRGDIVIPVHGSVGAMRAFDRAA